MQNIQTRTKQPFFVVHLKKVSTGYGAPAIEVAKSLLESLHLPVGGGDSVLIKPNLLRADPAGITCTNAKIVAAVCSYLLDKGCRVTIGDSPGFGTAPGVAKSIGLYEALCEAGCGDTRIITLDSPVQKTLSLGGTLGISRFALEAEHIVNVPKLKAHSQMRLTCAVKNLFGCVSGIRKAFLHARYGDKEKNGIKRFPSVVADVLTHLPPVTTLLDGIVGMHGTGPSGGMPYSGGLLAASESPVALDTAVYSLLGVAPEQVPVWTELQRRRFPGAFPEEIVFAGESVTAFDFSGFSVPQALKPETFNPARLCLSSLRRLWARISPC